MKYLEYEHLTNITAQLSDALVGQSHRVINGRIEAYSMKRAGQDKKVAQFLGKQYVAEMECMEKERAEAADRNKRHLQRQAEASTSQSRKRSTSAATWNEVAGAGTGSNPGDTNENPKKNCRMRSKSFDYALGPAAPKTSLGDFSELRTRKLMTDFVLTLQASFPDYDFSYVKPGQFEKLRLRVVRDSINERLNEFASNKASNWLMEMWSSINDAIELADCDVYSFEEEDLKDNSLWTFNYLFVNKALKRVLFFTCQEKIDDEGPRTMLEEEISFSMPDYQMVDDFDWDPSADVAGGIPISTA